MNKEISKKDGDILWIGKAEQYQTVEELVRRSLPNSAYYTLLVLSSLIITSGLLLGNNAIAIGGMLVTPVLSPLLLIGLGLSIGKLESTKRALILTGQSFLIVVLSSIILSLLFGPSELLIVSVSTMRTALLYLVVALAAGFAATFGWARKSIAEVLPGIAIAVSLVPPLSWIGIGISKFDVPMIRFNIILLLLNLVGIVVGSVIAFSLLKFYRVEKIIVKETKEAEEEIAAVKEEKKEEKEKEKNGK
jgi:uncharacterized hydrophobic protein (TIGR00271 family)